MAETRTQEATVKRLLGDKGVSIEEVITKGEKQFSTWFAVWLNAGHGLNVGDRARFYGQVSVKKTEKDGKVYVDLNLNDGQIVSDVVRAPQQQDANAAAWETAQPGQGWS